MIAPGVRTRSIFSVTGWLLLLLILLIDVMYLTLGVIPYYGSEANLHFTKARWEAPFDDNSWGDTLLNLAFLSALAVRYFILPVSPIFLLLLMQFQKWRLNNQVKLYWGLFIFSIVLVFTEWFVSDLVTWFLD